MHGNHPSRRLLLTRIIVRLIRLCAIAAGLSSVSIDGRRGAGLRVSRPRGTYHESTWARLLEHENVGDPTTKEGRSFRRRFRIPHPLFVKLVQVVRHAEWDGIIPRECDSAGRPCAPIELKLLAWLRVLGRGECFDSCSESTNVSEETLRVFFHKFSSAFSLAMFNIYVSPAENSELDMILRDYAALGFPGCVGSVDCVHVSWDRCPSSVRSLYCGSSGKPTLSYEMVVDHSRRVHSMTAGFPGATNDKTICKLDGFITALHNEELYNDLEFFLDTDDGDTERVVGGYVICDGGYIARRTFIYPLKVSSEKWTMLWSQQLESVRKDVECTFGVIKRRFQLFNRTIEFHSVEKIDNAFRCAVILHNMLLEHDGLTYASWESHPLDDPVSDLSDSDDDHDLADDDDRDVEEGANIAEPQPDCDSDPIDPEVPVQICDEERTPQSERWIMLTRMLITHFRCAFQKKKLAWIGSKCRRHYY